MTGPDGSGNGLERWRGEIGARVDDLEDSVSNLWSFKEGADKRIVALETKMVFFAAIAAAIGAMLPNVIQAALRHL